MSQRVTGFTRDYSEQAPTVAQISELVGDVLLEFGAPWCGHCQAASSAVQEALTAHVGLPHIKIYDGKGKTLGRMFKVKLWPTLILLRDGQEVDRLVRPLSTVQVRQLITQ